jgi:hypothetical protein
VPLSKKVVTSLQETGSQLAALRTKAKFAAEGGLADAADAADAAGR